MANPFSGTISGLNTGHANYGNLKYVYIPLSTTLVKEIVSATEVTSFGGNGSFSSYDADGYLWGASSSAYTTATCAVAGIANSASYTIIAAWKNNGTASLSAHGASLFRNAATYVKAIIEVDGNSARARGIVGDGTRLYTGGFATSLNTYCSLAVSSTAGAQKSWYKTSATLNASGGLDGTSTANDGGDTDTNTGNTMDRLTLTASSVRGMQYMLVYNAVLGQSDIDAIMADPGAVLSYESSYTPRRTLLGVG